MLRAIDTYHGNSQASVAAAMATADAVIPKASEGLHYVDHARPGTSDSSHTWTVTKARAARKLVGHYHFGWLGSPIAPQVAAFVAAAAALPGETLWLDVEKEAGATSAQWPNAVTRVAAVLAFVNGVNAATHAHCGVYANKSDWQSLLDNATTSQRVALLAIPLWIAAPSDPMGKPNIRGRWFMQQYGIVANIDRDVVNGDVAAWRAIAVPSAIVTPPPLPPGGHGSGVPVPPPVVVMPLSQFHGTRGPESVGPAIATARAALRLPPGRTWDVAFTRAWSRYLRTHLFLYASGNRANVLNAKGYASLLKQL